MRRCTQGRTCSCRRPIPNSAAVIEPLWAGAVSSGGGEGAVGGAAGCVHGRTFPSVSKASKRLEMFDLWFRRTILTLINHNPEVIRAIMLEGSPYLIVYICAGPS